MTDSTTNIPEPELPEGWAYVVSGPDKAKHVVKFSKPDKPEVEVFKLTKDAYHAVWLYVMTGLMYPQTNERFAEIVPNANLQALNEKDSQAWGNLRDAVVGIHKHCEAFNNDSMSSWVSLTNDVITYTKYALSNFNGPDNFTKSLEVLVGGKYKRATDDSPEPVHDQAYKDAVEVLQDICDDLKRNAEAKEAACQKHIDKLGAFRNDTMADKAKVDDLDFKFNSKKEKDGTTDRKCYSDMINDELAKVRADEKLQKRIEQDADDEYKKDVTVAATAVTYAWIFPVGTLAAIGVATAFGVKATEAQHRMEKAEKQYNDDVDRERALMTLCNWTSHMGETVHNLDEAMEKAIDGMKSIKEMFAEQKSGFDLIKTELGDAEGKFNKDYNLRKRILGKFSTCVEEWQKIQKLAQAFLDTSSPAISGVTEAKCVGNLEALPDAAKTKEPPKA